jgi:hypothetical protein
VLVASIERRFEGARCVSDGLGVRVELPFDGTTYHARAAMMPRGSVAIDVPHTDGFELTLAWTDRARTHRSPRLDDSYLVETNDVPLANAWLDTPARAALLASRFVATPSPRTTAVMMRDGAWTHELRGGVATAQKTGFEPSADRVVDLLGAALALAHRPVRWARRLAKLAAHVGGTASGRVEIGGAPILRVRRGAVLVTVRLLRRLDPDEPGRLRTVVGAHRIASSGETLQLIADDLPRAAWPPEEHSPGAPRLPIRPRDGALLDAADPAASIVRRHDVEITFDGVLVAAERLAAAIELAARWAADTAADGPYR